MYMYMLPTPPSPLYPAGGKKAGKKAPPCFALFPQALARSRTRRSPIDAQPPRASKKTARARDTENGAVNSAT